MKNHHIPLYQLHYITKVLKCFHSTKYAWNDDCLNAKSSRSCLDEGCHGATSLHLRLCHEEYDKSAKVSYIK